jgi:N-acetyl sugar amidotransferase
MDKHNLNLQYCKTCILPNTRPNINFKPDGSCNCATAQKKGLIDWKKRDSDFNILVNQIKDLNASYDCVIPVSGGKDSTWQTIKALEVGLRPLCVTWKTPGRNELGSQNLQNLINKGVDHIDFSINPKVEKIFTLKAFEKFGSPVIPMHMALHAIPLQVSIAFNIPLILWGENSAYEYGGDDESLKGVRLNRNWLKKYGVTNGTTAEDWADINLPISSLTPYIWPSDDVQQRAGVRAVFLGHYYQWDPEITFFVAKKHGFNAAPKPKTGLYSYADIDDDFLITIHHFLKWYKFGFTRLWDNLSLEIRNNRITRSEAIEMVERVGEEKPVKEIEKFCKYVDINESKFFEIAERFRNTKIWKKDLRGVWKIDNFLCQNWKWK